MKGGRGSESIFRLAIQLKLCTVIYAGSRVFRVGECGREYIRKYKET
jgi:hypothetical protein